jgi:AhpD family alkylhydroperoxidase
MTIQEKFLSVIENQGAQAIKYVQPVKPDSASGLLANIYTQIERDVGAALPPLALHSPAPEIFAGAWLLGRETWLAGHVRRDYKEAIIAAVSQTNTCPYCVDAHTMMLQGFSKHDAAEAIMRGRRDQLKDAKLRALVEWGAASRSPGNKMLLSPPFSPQDAPEIIGTTLAFHYINRMVNVFLDESPVPVPARFNGLKKVAKRIGASMMKEMVNRVLTPGESLQLLPEATLPDDLAWAASNPIVAGAYARFAAVIEIAGQAALPELVRTLVRERAQAWNGEDPGLSRRWLEEAITGLNEEHQPAARLALLTALASYQVDEGVINAFRAQQPGDDKLIEATAWASFTAARRIGSWLCVAEAEEALA